MSMSDPLADMLTRIRNGGMAKHNSVDIPHSMMKKNIAEILKQEGYITDFAVISNKPHDIIRIGLKYDQDNNMVISGLRRVSKPGCRVYVRAGDISPVLSGLGVALLSTSEGVMSGQDARKQQVGGELLCEVW